MRVERNLLFTEDRRDELFRNLPNGIRYNGHAHVRVLYAPYDGDTPIVYRGLLEFSVLNESSYVHHLHIPSQFHRSGNKYIAEIEASTNNPVQIEMLVEENRLRMPPTGDVLHYSCPKVDEFLENILKKGGSWPLNILDSFRRRFKYTESKGYWRIDAGTGTKVYDLDSLMEKNEGNCAVFSELFKYLGKKLGKVVRAAEGYGLNMVIRDEPVFKTAPVDTAWSHRWNEVWESGEWRIVDPTIFINSPDGLQFRAIEDVKDIYFLEFPYPRLLIINEDGIIPIGNRLLKPIKVDVNQDI